MRLEPMATRVPSTAVTSSNRKAGSRVAAVAWPQVFPSVDDHEAGTMPSLLSGFDPTVTTRSPRAAIASDPKPARFIGAFSQVRPSADVQIEEVDPAVLLSATATKPPVHAVTAGGT